MQPRQPLLIPAGNASPWTGPTGNNTYLLEGAVPALIDAGVGATTHVEAIAHVLGNADLHSVLVTHAHVDHISGVPALAARWTNLRARKLPPDLPRDFVPILAGERLAAGDSELLAVATPGHARDHCCFFDGRTGDLFCGDLVRAGGTILIPATRGGDLIQYLDSLRRVRDLRPKRLLPGHGPIVDDPVRLIDEYARHRAEREAEIVAALQSGCATVERIVARVYTGLSAALVPAAAETVTAHLIKLEIESRAEREGALWQLKQ